MEIFGVWRDAKCKITFLKDFSVEMETWTPKEKKGWTIVTFSGIFHFVDENQFKIKWKHCSEENLISNHEVDAVYDPTEKIISFENKKFTKVLE
jgi:hypothetical protein